jgi:23S rRNA pseudouridine1911/1915/1917 synthase
MAETHIIPAGVRRDRADKLLAAAFPMHSRVAWQRVLAAGLVLRDGRVLGRADELDAGDTVEYSFPTARPTALLPAAIPLDVIFEDEHLIAINKPPGMVVHPGAGTGGDTLVHALLSHCAGALSGVGGVERPGIVHRLDRETSGLILVAKSDSAHRALSDQFANRTLRKEYLALVAGVPRPAAGSVIKPIGRDSRQRHRMAVVARGGREARTDWVVEKTYEDVAALVRCVIHTGRTHQIRVHLKSLGHVLLGDRIYGWRPGTRPARQPERVMLHAERLVFAHPITGRIMELRARLPADFTAQLAALRKLVKMVAKKGR